MATGRLITGSAPSGAVFFSNRGEREEQQVIGKQDGTFIQLPTLNTATDARAAWREIRR